MGPALGEIVFMNWIPRIHQRDSALSSDPTKSSFKALFRRHSPLPDIESPLLRPHPFAAMHPPTVPVVATKQNDIEEECPVCLEPLSFSYRLPGEKPHIVPECGHALHEVCFLLVFLVPLIVASNVPGLLLCSLWPAFRCRPLHLKEIQHRRLWRLQKTHEGCRLRHWQIQ